jgi:glycosidase
MLELRFQAAIALVSSLSLGLGACANASDQPSGFTYTPPDGSTFETGSGDGGGSSYGSGGDGGSSDVATIDAPPTCTDDLKRCPATFTLPFKGETSVELRGDYRTDSWTTGDPLTHIGDSWSVSVVVPYSKPVQYKFVINGTTWETDPGNPATIKDSSGNTNSLRAAVTCDPYTCAPPDVPPPGVYDWRDAVIYFAFVDRFVNGDPSNDCPGISGVATPGAYQGGDWAGVKQKIDAGYFNALGVNTLWITVPMQNADDQAGLGVGGDSHLYSSYHGYWPRDPDKAEKCFGSLSDLKALVDSAHTAKLKVLLDYAMVHVHKTSSVYASHPDWFFPSTNSTGASCICGSSACSWDTAYQYCWFTDYLPHWNYGVGAARDYSVENAVTWIKNTGADGFRLDAIKHVDGSWLTQLRTQINTEILAAESPKQRFYMVGETYDFGNRDFIKSFVDPATKLDGQFDFPLRLHLVQSILLRSNGMNDLASFMDSNEDFYGTGAVMSTFVGNHDLPRSIHIGDDTPLWTDPYSDGKDRSWSGQPTLPAHRSAFERMANALAVIFTNKGAPLLYYGDEIGLPGAGDPDNRRMMQWTGLSTDQQWLHDRVAKLLSIRAAHPAMRRGARKTLTVNADLWVYSMTTSGDAVTVAVNRGDTDQSVSTLPSGALHELVNDVDATGPTAVIPERQTRVFVTK